jgi:hypothetical protein
MYICTVVISHCGMVSAQEALIFGKPVLCLPFLMDQPDVAARVVDAGAGFMLDKTHFTADEVHHKALELIRNASYAAAANQIGTALQDAGGIERALEIVTSMLLFGSAHLTTMDLRLPWHKCAMLDVWAVYISVFCTGIVIMHAMWLLVVQLVFATAGLLSEVLCQKLIPALRDRKRQAHGAS